MHIVLLLRISKGWILWYKVGAPFELAYLLETARRKEKSISSLRAVQRPQPLPHPGVKGMKMARAAPTTETEKNIR